MPTSVIDIQKGRHGTLAKFQVVQRKILALPLKNCVEADAKPVSSSLPFSSQAARIKYGAPAAKTADAAFLRSTLNPSPPSFLACFFFSFSFLFLSLANLSPSPSFGFFRSFPFSVLLGTLPKFHAFLSVYLSPHSDRHLLDLTKPYGETLSSQ